MDEPIVIDDDGDDDSLQKGAKQETKADSAGGAPGASECFICSETYDEKEHKAAVLKCGHFAGEPCLRRWLRDKKLCALCRKPAKARDIVVLYNLPTVRPASGGGEAAPGAAAAAAGSDPSAVADRELMLRKVQRKCCEIEEEAKRVAREREEHERENKRLRLELEATQRQLAAIQQQQQQQQASVAQPAPPPPPPLHHQHPQQPPHPGHQSSAAPYPPPGSWPPSQNQRHQHPGHHHHQHPGHPAAPGPSQALPGGPPLPPPGQVGGYASSQRHHPGDPGGGGGGAVGAAAVMAAGGGGGTVMPLPAGTQTRMAAYPGSGMWGYYGAAPAALQGYHPHGGHAADGPGGQPSTPPYGFGNSHTAMYGNQHTVVAGGYGSSSSNAGARGPFEQMLAVPVRGCRLVALDAAGGRLLVSESHDGGRTCCGIRKFSMVASTSSTVIRLPAEAGILYDLQLPAYYQHHLHQDADQTHGGSTLAALVTRGSCLPRPRDDASGLSLLCTAADTVVGGFSGLPHRPQSCSWVPGREHLLVAGLERGHVALLDTRRTDGPVAVVAALQQGPPECAALPVRGVVALPGCAPGGGGGGGQGQQGTWPPCVVSCIKGAWLMLMLGGGAAGGTAGEAPAAAPRLLRLDPGAGAAAGGGMQLESVCVQPTWGSRADEGAPGPGEGRQPAWRAALSWRPADATSSHSPAPRHDVGTLRSHQQQPFMHEVSLGGHSRRGIQAVRSCFIPPPQQQQQQQHPLMLASADDATHQPLIWSLGSGSGSGQIVQRLEPHPEPPACLVAALGAGAGPGSGQADCFLACGSAARVAVYRRRVGWEP